MNKIFEKLKKIKPEGKRRLGSYLALMTGFLIAGIIIVTMAYVFNHIKSLAIEYNTRLNTFNYSLSSLLRESFDNAYKSNDVEKISGIIQSLKDRDMITYIYAVDTKTDKVFFSSSPQIMNKSYQEAKKDLFLKYQNQDTTETSSSTRDYTLYMGMPVQKIVSTYLNSLLENIKIFLAFFLLIGIFASAVMSRIILTPLTELTKGVKEFAKGSLILD